MVFLFTHSSVTGIRIVVLVCLSGYLMNTLACMLEYVGSFSFLDCGRSPSALRAAWDIARCGQPQARRAAAGLQSLFILQTEAAPRSGPSRSTANSGLLLEDVPTWFAHWWSHFPSSPAMSRLQASPQPHRQLLISQIMVYLIGFKQYLLVV